MTAPTTTLRTAAETKIIERFKAARPALPGSAAVDELREKAFAAFERQGLPHRRVEEWKYSDLRGRLKEASPLAVRAKPEAASAALKAADDVFAAVDRYRLVVVDGFFEPSLSDVEGLRAEGVEIGTLSEIFAKDDACSAELFAVPEIADDIAVSLNTAFAGDGVVVSIPNGARLSKPVEIVHVAGTATDTAVYARNTVIVGDGAEAVILEGAFGGTDGSEINLVFDYRIGDGVKVAVARLQGEARGTTHITSGIMRLGAKAEVKHLSVGAGAGFARNQTFLTFAGEHSRADILGVGMIDATRHIDQTLVVDHAVPHCTSAELFKTVIADRATGVFQGKIIVRQDAQKTAGKMMSQALLLSEEAEMAAKPELEIFADDVICGHGATSGQIDEEMLFYLMARGIPRAEAERLLIEAFLAGAVDAFDNEIVGEALKTTISDWLNARNMARETKAA